MFWNRKLRVAIVEDEPIQAQRLQLMLKKMGTDPRIFDSAEALFAALKKSPMDLILMDMMLPGILGGEAVQRIRFGEFGLENSKAMIVGLSASEAVPDGHAERKGAELFLRKPVDNNQLESIVAAAKKRE